MTMRSRMIAVLAATAATVGAAAQAPAADPSGNWMAHDGAAVIRIVDCGGSYWGVVAWEKRRGVDSHNPNAALRTRPTLGMPVLLDLKRSAAEQWSGHIYNSEDGQTYEGHISLTGANRLRVEGCVLGFLCGGETWNRVAAAPAAAVAERGRHATTGSGRTRRSIAEQPAAQVCSGLAGR